MKWLKNLFSPKEEWRLVASFKYSGGIQSGTDEGELYYHLFESSRGNRKIQTRCTIQDAPQAKLDKFAKSTEFYQTKLYRWLVGRSDPEINRYEAVDQEETMHELKGTIDETV